LLMSMSSNELVADRIFVDGHNLVLRAQNAPALARLKDRKGRLTGVFHGVLRTVLSLQESAYGARITFVWDGSSLRRKAIYSGYKSNRQAPGGGGASGPSHDVEWLRYTLPMFGVEQAFNADEEADDVIAALVRKTPETERALILSTDRDFLQLVTERVCVLAPPPKSVLGRGKIYDVARVKSEYGVASDTMVLLRAVAGDVSDNLQGVDGIGPKIAAKLWALMGPVLCERDPGGERCGRDLLALDRAFALLRDGAKGLTKLQVKRLLAAETVVRRNVALMTLLPGVDVSVTPARQDERALERELLEFGLSALAKARKSTKTRTARQTSFRA